MKLIPKKRQFLGKDGQRFTISDEDNDGSKKSRMKEVVRKTKDVNGKEVIVKEMVYITSSGSFDSRPLELSGYQEAFKLPNKDRKELLDEGYRLWKYDALGGTIVSLTTYFVLGRGLTFQFDEQEVQDYATKFFEKNNLAIKLRSACDEATAFGEVFIWLRPHFVNVKFNGIEIWRAGDVQISFITPENITNIAVAEEDPSNPYAYVYEYLDENRNPVIKNIPDISKYSATGTLYDPEDGCIVHIKLNAGNMDAFGHSDLIRVKEWLDNYQEYLRDGVVINKLYRSPCYDVAIEDAGQEEIDAAVARYRNWTIGSNPIHNAKEQWQILEFKGPNSSSENARRSLLLIVAAGVGFAEYMLADGANANLASSKSQQLPVIKKFEDRQDVFAYHLNKVFQFALKMKSLKGKVGYKIDFDTEGDAIDFKGKITFPAIAQDKDLEVAQTNELAIGQGIMSPRTAAARLSLDYDREVEIMLSDDDLIKALKAKGYHIIVGKEPPPPPKPASNGNSQSR